MEIKKIVRGVIIGVLISVIMMFIRSCKVSAAGSYVLLDSTRMSSNTFVYKPTGNVTFLFWALSGDDSVYYDNYPEGSYSYYMTTFCSDIDEISSYYNDGSNSNIATFEYYLSDVPCKFSNGYEARLVYFYGQLDPNYGLGSSTTFDPYAKFVFYNVSSSWQVLANYTSDKPITIDFTTGGIVSQNKEIIEQNETIINQNSYLIDQNNNTYNMEKSEFDETQEKLDDINSSINNDDVDTEGAGSFFSDFSTVNHGGISGVITAPLSAISKVTDTCKPFSFTIKEQVVELPCGDTLFWNREGFEPLKIIWNIIFGGGIIYALVCKLFKVIQNLKNPDDDRVEMMNL